MNRLDIAIVELAIGVLLEQRNDGVVDNLQHSRSGIRRLRSRCDRHNFCHCPSSSSSIVDRPVMMLALSVMLLMTLFANDGMAFSTNKQPSTGRIAKGIIYLTSLAYKNGAENEQHHDTFTRSKRSKLRLSKKKYKARKPKSRSYSLRKKGVPASEEELANHLQHVFSDLKEFGGDGDEEEEEPCIVSEAGESGGTSLISAEAKQLESCKKLARHPTLVLNADYQPLRMLPLSIWSWQDTVKAVLSGKAVVVDIYPDVFVRAVNLDMPVPSVIALREYIPTGKTKPAFTRRNVFLRDGYRCKYCSEPFRTSDLTLDHVEPRCFGGKLTWDNTVTCCKKCNGRKGCLRPSEIHRVGMELKTQPRCPTLFELASEATKFVPRRVHPTWAPFLGMPAVDEESNNNAKEDNTTRGRKGGE